MRDRRFHCTLRVVVTRAYSLAQSHSLVLLCGHLCLSLDGTGAHPVPVHPHGTLQTSGARCAPCVASEATEAAHAATAWKR